MPETPSAPNPAFEEWWKSLSTDTQEWIAHKALTEQAFDAGYRAGVKAHDRPTVRIDPLHSVTCDYEDCEADATWLVGDFYRCDDHRGTGAYGEDAG